jgi:GAF domain-containing protein
MTEPLPPDRLRRILSAAANAPASLPPLERLMHAAVDMLDLAGAATILMTEDGGGVVVATAGQGADTHAARQFELGEGPSLTAHRDGEPVLTADLQRGGDARWPVLAHDGDSVRAVLAVPMAVGAVRLGVVSLHRGQPGRWTTKDYLDALALTDLATSATLDGVSGVNGAELEVIPNHAVVHQATGMLAARLDLDLAAALARLRGLAFADGRTLHDVAVDVVDGRQVIDP